jgi:dsRNA-specific ribonuclease
VLDLQVHSVSTTGKARKKKAARQAAAQSALDQLKERQDFM